MIIIVFGDTKIQNTAASPESFKKFMIIVRTRFLFI